MNELERRPTKYIKKLFKFLTDEGFGRKYYSCNAEESLDYEKDGFHIVIAYDCFMKMKWVNIDVYHKMWNDSLSLAEKLCIVDENHKTLFQGFDELNCMEQLNIAAKYIDENLMRIMQCHMGGAAK